MKERDNLSEIAVKINGEYIEDIIPGYKTMNVIGWWSVERELETEENHEVGVIVKEEYYPPRELIVEFSRVRQLHRGTSKTRPANRTFVHQRCHSHDKCRDGQGVCRNTYSAGF